LISSISRNIKNASVAIEDEEFYQHHGIKFTSIIRAILANLTSGGYSQGGSTITQQVIKNSLLTTEKSISRKLKEWILSLKLEREMNKDEILTLYLNEAPFGGNIYGVEEAAKNFFGKHASEVTLGEAAYLAALPNAPSYYSPYGGNRSALEKRKKLVLERMLKNAFITKEEYDNAMAEKVNFNPVDGFGIKAPHFVMYIKGELEKRFGTDVMESSGLKVITTLDYDLEKKAEEIVAKYAEENEKNFNATNAAMTAVDPKTGEILVMVGSRNYFDQKIDGNFNIITAKRQPGSSIKPFVYATAFEKGYTPETVLFDVKTEFSSECNPDGTPKKDVDEKTCYMPENYDEKYRGPITLRSAHAQRRFLASREATDKSPLTQRSLARHLAVAPSTINRAIQGRSLVLPWGEEVLLEDLFCTRKSLCVDVLEALAVDDADFTDRTDEELQARLKERLGLPVPRRTVNSYRRLLEKKRDA
jgi:membrane peptidoglycan carboxypeptidase